ncbi:MAG: tetratricopeptide repeat protein [Polyangiaceae bacterium]
MTTKASKVLLATGLGALVVLGLALPPLAEAQTGGAAKAPAAKPTAKAATTAKGTTTKTAADAGAPKAAADAGTLAAVTTDGGEADAATAEAPASTGAQYANLAAPRKTLPPPPPPTVEQVRALEALKAQAQVYEKGAKDYRDTISSIVQLHYEQKKKEVLSGLDREIGIEKGELRKARDTAIERLEAFVAKYSGTRANDPASPDAMYRLASLYEERARGEDAKEDLLEGLKPAIALYKRIIREYPKYKELAGVFYFLGHAYNDSGRIDEGQQVWRALVCANKYTYPTPPDPKNPDADTILGMPQDKKESEWIAWRHRYPMPESLRKGGPDTKFLDPFPKECKPLAQPSLKVGEEPRYVAEVWWQIGNWEFDQLDLGSGRVLSRDEPDLVALPPVYGYNRAASAYNHSLEFKKPPLYGVALYKYSWTLFKQQRYDAATREFIHLLLYTDEQQKLTGDPGADFRAEAFTYIAGSLTNVDFKGPEADDPYVPRPDIIDTESNPAVAEQKLRVAIERVKDPTLIPQDKPWTIEIYKALALEYRSLNHYDSAIEVYTAILKKWPMDPTAPDVQAAVAETYDMMLVTKKPGTPEHDVIAAKALEARTALVNYIGNTAWVDANKDNPAAIQNAERLVKGGLRQAAVQHTTNGRAALQDASQSSDPKFVAERLTNALSEYRLAVLGWQGYLKQDENAPDAYESRYWLADARRQTVRIQVVLHKLKAEQYPEPQPREIDDARAAAIDVRDSNEDDKFIDNAALWVVDLADVKRDLEYVRFEETKGAQGIDQRTEVRFTGGEGADKKVEKAPVPPQIIDGIRARDEYVERVPTNLDVNKNALTFGFYSAEVFFLYGQFEEARARFEPMYRDHCGKDEYGYKAWEKLITMSNLSQDAERSRQLAEAEKTKSCAVNAEQQSKGALIVNPTLQEAAYVKARDKFKAAQAAPAGPEKARLWREAAGLYEAALSAAPGRDEAPEAAMNAAYAYKQIGEYQKAIDLYTKFIDEYGSDARLNALQKGDPKTKAGPDPKRYQERLSYLNDAFDALSNTYFGFFNYQRAAETYDKISANDRFDDAKRKVAARNAMVLYAKMGQREKMMGQYRVLQKLKLSPEEKATADYDVAKYDYQQWNSQAADTGANRQSRLAAEQALQGFYASNKNNAGAGKQSLEAAYLVAKLKKTGGDVGYRTWFKTTQGAWESLRAKGTTEGDKPAALQPPYADYGAEAEFTLLDEEIKDKYDFETGRHKYTGSVEDVIGKYEVDKSGARKQTKKGKYQLNAEDADKYDQKLSHIADTYPSLDWVPAAIARKGTLFDSLRMGLYNTVPPALKYFTPQQEALLKKLEDSGRDDLMMQADELRDRVKEGWRSQKEVELAASDEIMVRNYATAVALARQYNVKNPTVSHAIARLAYFTDILGDVKMKGYVEKTRDPNDPAKAKMLSYSDGMYVQARSGIALLPPTNGNGSPLPVAP